MAQQVNLLIVDDDEELGQTLGDILQGMGYGVEIALSGKEALRNLEGRYFNLALIDIKLPDADGLELLHKLKLINPEMEGIVITGYGSLETAREALRRGAFDYVLKPLKMEEVLSTVREALAKQRRVVEEKQRLNQEQEAKEFYRTLSIVDGLTGLYNYRHFRELLTQEIRRSRRYSHLLSLLMVDIDNFKNYNDAYGHPAGDEALKVIAETMQSKVRGVDVVGRYGGEEFVIILPETPKAHAAIVAERVRKAVAETTLPTGDRLTISIGVVTYPEDAPGNEELISLADKALYQAKQGGRNQIRVWEQG